jgi:pimeloyl-ACP methyl ester carboxylesterase
MTILSPTDAPDSGSDTQEEPGRDAAFVPHLFTLDGAQAGGSRLHLLAAPAGPPPLVLYDAGAFGIYADGWHVIEALRKRGVPAAAYSRAGLGDSDAVPEGTVPSPLFHAQEMARLLDRLGQKGPVVLVGHSMAGLRLHAFAALYPERSAGLVLVDAVTPEQIGWVMRRQGTRAFAAALGLAEAPLPLIGHAAPFYPNGMQLSGRARADKLRSVSSRTHLRATRLEIKAAVAAEFDGAITPLHGRPMVLMPAGPVARGTARLAEEAKAKGGKAEIVDMREWGHASILSPRPAGLIAEAARRLLP